jgi:proteic killer suppression protein
MISSFRDKETKRIFDRIPSGKFRAIQGRAEEKLVALNAASQLLDVSLPSMRLEKLAGNRKGQYSIRINGQYRICFIWRDGNAHEVEIVDYH